MTDQTEPSSEELSSASHKSENQSTELTEKVTSPSSIIAVRAACYKFVPKLTHWQSLDSGISRVDICTEDKEKALYKIVGISSDTVECVLLFTVYKDSFFDRSTQSFLQFYNPLTKENFKPSKDIFGLNFASVEEADNFYAEIVKIQPDSPECPCVDEKDNSEEALDEQSSLSLKETSENLKKLQKEFNDLRTEVHQNMKNLQKNIDLILKYVSEPNISTHRKNSQKE